MATAYPVYSPASAPGLAQFLDADTCKVGILQTVGDAYVGGKLGVGTLTPATLGHFASGATGGTILTLEQAYGDTDAPDLTIKKARGTLAAPTVITTADDLGMISFAGYSGAGGYVVGAAIKATSEGTVATTRVPGRLTFWTGTDAAPTVLTERMRITSDGKVGIGTASPAARLSVKGVSTDDVQQWIDASGNLLALVSSTGVFSFRSDIANVSFAMKPLTGSNKNRIFDFFANNDSGNSPMFSCGIAPTIGWVHNTLPGAFIGSVKNGSATALPLYFLVSDGIPADAVPAMTILTTSKVGIGCIDPVRTLEVRNDSYPAIQGTRTSAVTNSVATGIGIEHRTSGDMVSGFGSSLTFLVRDSAGVSNAVVSLQGIRTSTDDTGDFAVHTIAAGVGTEKMRVTSDGKVGIGCIDPGAALEVRSSGVPVIQGTRTSSSTNLCLTGLHAVHRTTADMVDGFGAGLGFAIRDSAGDLNLIASIQALRAGADNTGDLTFSTCTAGSEITKMWIKSTGLVGIGTNSPNQELEVLGTIRSSAISNTDNIFFQGFNYASGGTRIEVARISEPSTAGAGGLLFSGTRTGSGGNGTQFSSYNPSSGSSAFEYRAHGGTMDTPAAWPSGPNVAVFSKWNGSSVDPLVTIDNAGKVGIGLTSPTAVLHLKAGTTAASTAPLKLTSGDLMTAPEAGAIEFLSDKFYGTITTGTVRSAFVFETRSVSTGTGLSGGGDLSANRTLTLDQAVIPTWTGAHTFTGGVTFKNHSAFAGSGFIPETRAIQTTTVTPAVLWSKTLADDTLYWVEVRVIGRDTAGVERAYYGRTFYVYRQNPGGAVLGNVIELFSEETDADWDVGVNVNTNDVEVKVTGKSSVTINWAGTVTMQAVSGNA